MGWDPRSPVDPTHMPAPAPWWDDPRFTRTRPPDPAPAPPPGPAPTTPLPEVPSPIAPEEFASILYGRGIPSILAGTVEVGGNIIEGPFFGASGNEIIVSFIAAYYTPINYWDATRTVTRLRFHGTEAWNSTDGVLLSGLNVGGATTGTEQRVRFTTGTLTQTADAWSVGINGAANAIAYVPLVTGVFENIRVLQFNNQVPFTSVEVQDTAFGDPDDLVSWADALPAIMRFSGRPADEFEAIDVSEGEYAYIFNGKIMDVEFLAGMKKLKPNWNILTKDKLYVVEKGITSLDLTVDLNKLIKRGTDPFTIHHADILLNTREKLVNFSDVERDYESSTVRVAEDLEPIESTEAFDSETLSFPGVSTASRMLAQAQFAYATEEMQREKSEFTGNRYYLGLDPGDTYRIPTDEMDYFHRASEVVRKADMTVDVKGEGVLTCALAVDLDDLDLTGMSAGWSMSRTLLSSYTGTYYDTSVGQISSINDQSGHSYDFTQTGGLNGPAVSTAGANSRACASFNGIDESLHTFGVTLAELITASDGYIIISAIVDALTTNSATIYLNDALFASNLAYMGFGLKHTSASPDVSSGHAYNYDGNYDIADTTFTIGDEMVVELRREGGNLYSRINKGSWVGPIASGNTQVMTDDLHLFRSPLGAILTDGKFFEMVAFKVVPDEATRDSLATNFMNWIGAS